VGEVSTRGKDGKDVRSAAQIEADIVRTRQQLAATLDELAVAVHPSTIIGSVKLQVRNSIEEKTGKAFVAVNRSVEQVKGQFVDAKGNPRKERIVPVAAAGAALVAGVVLLRRRRK
jgi:MYXO-CTERM domain-containing protein